MSGVLELMRSKSSMRRSTSASRATPSRCSTPLVEPPVAAMEATAFSSAARVITCRAVRFLRTSSMTISPTR